MEKKVIITAAVTGSRPTKQMNPAIPYTPDEIVKAALESHRAGAAIVHIHVRNPETGQPAFKSGLFKEVLEGIRHDSDMIVNLTTSALFLEGPDVTSERLQPVYLKPDICSLDLGSINYPDRVFINPPGWGEIAAKCMRENNVKPEIEVFDVGHIYQALDLVRKGLIDNPPYFQLCMGVRWGIEASPENLLFMKNKLPPNAIWSTLGVGKSQLSMIILSMLSGGNIRVGFEDNIYLREGVLASSNAEIVETTAEIVKTLGYHVATPQEARLILGIQR